MSPPHVLTIWWTLAQICWRVWGTPANFNGFRFLAELLHGTRSGHKPKFAALNRGRHLHSEARPLRWALVHIPVVLLNCAHSIMTVLCLRDVARCWLKITNFFPIPPVFGAPLRWWHLNFAKAFGLFCHLSCVSRQLCCSVGARCQWYRIISQDILILDVTKPV